MGAAFCPACGRAQKAGTKFCGVCGENLERISQIGSRARASAEDVPETRGRSGTVLGVPGVPSSPPAGVTEGEGKRTQLGLPPPDAPRRPGSKPPPGIVPSQAPTMAPLQSTRPSAPGSLPAGVLADGSPRDSGAPPSASVAPPAPAAAAPSGRAGITFVVVMVVAVLAVVIWQRGDRTPPTAPSAPAPAAAPPAAPAPPTTPALAVATPGRVTTDGTVLQVRGTAHPASAVEVDGLLVENAGGRFAAEVALTGVGRREVVVEAACPEGAAADCAPERVTLAVERVPNLRAYLRKRPLDRPQVLAKLLAAPDSFRGKRVSFIGTVVAVEDTASGAFLDLDVLPCGEGSRCPLWVRHAGAFTPVIGARVRIVGEVTGSERRAVLGAVAETPRIDADIVFPLGGN